MRHASLVTRADNKIVEESPKAEEDLNFSDSLLEMNDINSERDMHQ